MVRDSFMLWILLVITTPGLAGDEAPRLTDSTFADNLMAVKFIGLSVDKELLGVYAVRAYTKSQFDEHAASLEEYHNEVDARQARILEDNARIRAAHAKGASIEEQRELVRQAREAQGDPPSHPLQRDGVKLYRVVEVGADYFAVQLPGNPDHTTLIPFNKISRFVRETTPVSRAEAAPE